MEELQNVESKILTIRGLPVMLDRDFAELYGVKTKKSKKSPPLLRMSKKIFYFAAQSTFRNYEYKRSTKDAQRNQGNDGKIITFPSC